MTRLYGYLTAIFGAILAVLTFGAVQRRKGKSEGAQGVRDRATRAADERRKQRDEINSASGDDAADRLRDDWSRD